MANWTLHSSENIKYFNYSIQILNLQFTNFNKFSFIHRHAYTNTHCLYVYTISDLVSMLRPRESRAGLRGSQREQRDVVDSAIHKPPQLLLNSLRQLRYDVLTAGVNGEDSRYRNYLWTILLQCDLTHATDLFVKLVKKGASPADAKIRSDSFRTMATDQNFKEKVSEDSLLRVLNAFAWYSGSNSYVQGMNVLCAPFLFVCRSESQAFVLFANLLTSHCPLYVRPDLVGVHTGVKLVNIVLELTDPKLYKRLKQKMLTAEIYALASVMTLSACTPPLSELLNLWDLYFAYGCSLNIIAVVAQVVDMRQQLLQSEQPAALLRKLPPLNCESIKTIMLAIMKHIPEDLWDLVRRHAFDESVPRELQRWMARKQ